MSSVVEFFNRKTRQVAGVVNETFFRFTESTSPLDQLMPLRSYDMRELLLLKFDTKPLIGSVVAEDQEIPRDRPVASLDEQLIGNLKIGHGYEFVGRDFELMQKMQDYLAQGGPRAQSIVSQLEQHFFGTAANLVPALVGKHTYLTIKVALTGACTYTDPLTGAVVSLTYPGTISGLLPAALSGTSNWSAATTANGLQNLQDHAEDYYDEFGTWPDTIVMRWKNLRELANQTSTKGYYVSTQGLNLDSSQVGNLFLEDDPTINLIKQRTRCRQVVIFDAKFAYKDDAGAVTEDYYLPDDYYFFAEPGNLERAIVPTIENNFNPGIYTLAEVKSRIPRKETITAVVNGVPFLKDSRKVAARKVNS